MWIVEFKSQKAQLKAVAFCNHDVEFKRCFYCSMDQACSSIIKASEARPKKKRLIEPVKECFDLMDLLDF